MARYRLDFLVAKKLEVSRSAALKLIKQSKVKVQGQIITDSDKRCDEDADIEIEQNKLKHIPLPKVEVLYEDDNCLVINKQTGLLTHSKGAFSDEATVASWLTPKTSGFGDNNRAGIVHRLDRATSGVMICAKNPETLTHFQKQFSARKVKKTYFALIEGLIEPDEAIIDVPIERNPKDPKRFKASGNGKPAQTHYKIVKSLQKKGGQYTLLELAPKTGRTHQLRVHLDYLKHPIIGDTFYGGAEADRLYLHAFALEITLPGGERKIFEADLPDSFDNPKIGADG